MYEARRKQEAENCKSVILIIGIIGAFIGGYISLIHLSDTLCSHNPNAHPTNYLKGNVFGCSMPKEYHFYHDNCDLRITSAKEDIDGSKVVTVCSKLEVLRANTDLICKDVNPHIDYPLNQCYEIRPCQNDMCKYNCNFTQHHIIHLNVSVRPWGSLFSRSNLVVERKHVDFKGVGLWSDYNMSWSTSDSLSLTTTIDSKGQIPLFAPDVVLCDYLLNDEGHMKSLYLNRQGSFIIIILNSVGIFVWICAILSSILLFFYGVCTAPW